MSETRTRVPKSLPCPWCRTTGVRAGDGGTCGACAGTTLIPLHQGRGELPYDVPAYGAAVRAYVNPASPEPWEKVPAAYLGHSPSAGMAIHWVQREGGGISYHFAHNVSARTEKEDGTVWWNQLQAK